MVVSKKQFMIVDLNTVISTLFSSEMYTYRKCPHTLLSMVFQCSKSSLTSQASKKIKSLFAQTLARVVCEILVKLRYNCSKFLHFERTTKSSFTRKLQPDRSRMRRCGASNRKHIVDRGTSGKFEKSRWLKRDIVNSLSISGTVHLNRVQGKARSTILFECERITSKSFLFRSNWWSNCIRLYNTEFKLIMFDSLLQTLFTDNNICCLSIYDRICTSTSAESSHRCILKWTIYQQWVNE